MQEKGCVPVSCYLHDFCNRGNELMFGEMGTGLVSVSKWGDNDKGRLAVERCGLGYSGTRTGKHTLKDQSGIKFI